AKPLVNNISDFIGVLRPFENKVLASGKLRILVFNWRDTKHVWAGGAEVYINEMAKRWVRGGNQVTIFCGNDEKNKRNEIVDGVKVIRRGGFYMVYFWAFFYYVFRFRGQFDVIVDCENGIPFFSPIYSALPKILLIHHVHQEVFRNHLMFPLSFIARKLEADLMPALYKNTPVVTVSESSRDDIVKRGWAKPEDVCVVNPGVDFTKFIKVKKTPNPSFVYLGRIKEYKNIDLLLYAFSRIRKDYPDAKLSIAGDGESLNSLKLLANDLKISNSVSFLHRVDDETRAYLLSQSWAAVQPSSYEGWGLTVLEANASGTCVIASDVKGLRDSVVDNQTGILFPMGNVEALISAMEKIINDKSLRIRLSENAYVWSARFNWDNSANIFENLFINILPQKQLIAEAYGNL
ncbi:hypothetical protein A2159_03435, partial [Candidatus Woesebacteria bacterium RBG_13_34_9]